MCGGGTNTTTQQVTIPPDVLARYNSVNNTAQQVASTPFQVYSTDPSAFVAPLTSTQQSGIANTNAAAGQAQPYFGAATSGLLAAQAGAQPYFDAAGNQYVGAEGAASPYIGSAANDIGSGLNAGNSLALAAMGSMNSAGLMSQPLENKAANNLTAGLSAAQPYNSGALGAYTQGLAAAQPLNTAANQNISGAQAGAQPYQQLATQLGLAGAQAVNPSALTGQNIDQYMSPYLGTVLNSTQALLNQQNQQQQSGALGEAMRTGAFGGDRAGIAAANLAQQQSLANNSIYSGILNNAYGQALSTAQQQQGLGLSAEQANRAALQAASGQLQSIGQQGFGQGLTAAQAQAALGQQEYGQYSGLGSNVAGLGNQVYSQNTGTGQAQAALGNQMFTQGMSQAQLEAALGNQLFGQNLSAAQAQAGLGQQVFGMGSQTGQNLQGLGQVNYATGANTSQQLAGLGTGAQSAALQGAQAQLAAGQVAQQTQQAGDTALYNQFLQQQSYPFQVAQFLANIAEGTGALSGSTTTTTQPGGFFSDRRLKEDVKLVGLTFDKQPIYSFKYKGDPRTQIGLMAQDVEKTHPGAVGLAAGFKTVDYAKATKGAAKRGKFAEGGAPGFDPAVMQQILANAQGMYGPYLTAGSPGPYGGSGRVPAANLPVGQLKIATAAPQQESALARAKQIADLAGDAQKGATAAQDAWHWLDKKSDPDVPPFRRGGPTHRADGGDTPYVDQEGGLSLDIPNDKPTLDKLPTPGTAPKSASGMDDAKDAADVALAVAKIAAMFRRGGTVKRHGYALDGFVDDPANDDGVDDFNAPAPGGGLVYQPTDNTTLAQIKAGQVTPKQIGHQGLNVLGLFGDGAGAGTDIGRSVADWAQRKLSPLVTYGMKAADANAVGSLYGGDPSAAVRAAPKAITAPPRRTALAAAASNGPPPLVGRDVGDIAAPPPGLSAAAPQVTQEMTPQTAGADSVSGADPATANQPLTSTPDDLQAPHNPSILDRLQASPVGGYFSGLKHGDLPTWISLLSAIGAAGTAPTVHPGVALAAGLTGGARGYMGAKEAQANIAKTQAETGVQQAEAGNVQAESYQRKQSTAPAGYLIVPGPNPNGKSFIGPDGKLWHYQLQATATDFGSPATGAAEPEAKVPFPALAPSSGTDAYMASTYHIDPSQPAVANHARALAMNPELAPLDETARTALQARIGNLQDTDNTHRQLVQLSQAINDLSHSTLTGQGHGSEYRTRLANIYTTTANLLGIPVDSTVTSDLAANQIIAKIKELSGAAMAHQYGERAASIAHSISGVLPGGDLQPAAANELLAQMIVQTQQPRDLSQYANNYAGRYGLMVNVEPSFQRDAGPVYDRDQRSMQAFMASPAFSPALADLQSTNPTVRDRAIKTLDGKYGSGFHRYFTGGQ